MKKLIIGLIFTALFLAGTVEAKTMKDLQHWMCGFSDPETLTYDKCMNHPLPEVRIMSLEDIKDKWRKYAEIKREEWIEDFGGDEEALDEYIEQTSEQINGFQHVPTGIAYVAGDIDQCEQEAMLVGFIMLESQKAMAAEKEYGYLYSPYEEEEHYARWASMWLITEKYREEVCDANNSSESEDK